MLTVSIAETADRIVVSVSGECDMSSSGGLASALDAAMESSLPVEVDLAELQFLDSSGIHVLVTAYHASQVRSATVYVTRAAGMVATVLELTGVGALLAPQPQGER
ncbi:STAS domain-containing protein [Catellatospora sp. NPDC049111]|uniref:STAS domain-containing protein n=1 Tax=Catellatospora sp. NPDC049111 TaxID=3155271 RepID=UPI0033DBD75B